jgi:hypothetical protein
MSYSDKDLERKLHDGTHAVPPASAHQKARFMQAYLAAGSASQPAGRPSGAWPRALWRPLALAGAALVLVMLLLAAILLTGGVRPPTLARVEAGSHSATIQQLHMAPLQIFSWLSPLDLPAHTTQDLAEGDRIQTNGALTLTFADGSVSTLGPDTAAVLLARPNGLRMEYGRVLNRVPPQTSGSSGSIRFTVESPNASYTVLGTLFSVQTSKSGDLLDTESGFVQARTPLATADVRAGEQVSITPHQTILAVGLQAPHLALATGSDQAQIVVRGYPHSVVTLIDAGHANLLGSATLNAAGEATVTIKLAADQRTVVVGSLRAGDGRQSSLSTPLLLAQATQSPGLRISVMRTAMGSLRIAGQTEPGTAVTVNDTPVDVQADGSFRIDLSADGVTVLHIAAQDAQGNRTSIYLAP